MTLRRNSPDMLHEQLARQLRRLVRELPVGSQIPTEPDLIAQYQLSRTTVRRAVDALVAEGLLARRPPRGTFVTAPRLQHTLDHVGAFLDTLSAGDRQPTPKLVAIAWPTEPDQLPAGMTEVVGFEVTDALHFERLYAFDDQPCALAQCWIAPPFAAKISRGDLEEHPSFEVFTHKLGLPIDRTKVTVAGADANADQAKRLHIAERTSLFVVHRWLYTTGDQLVQYSIRYLPTDRFELEFEHPSQANEDLPHSVPHAILSLVQPTTHVS